MESSSAMSSVSLSKNGKGKKWALPAGVTLRKGQQKCIDYVLSCPDQASYLFQLPTGYGKTYVAALLIQALRDQQRAKRFVVVVPNVTLLDQMVKEGALAKACERLNVKLSGEVMSASEPLLMARLKGGKKVPEVIVTTIQGLSSTSGKDGIGGISSQNVRKFCEGDDVAWICDEAHHYGAENLWGQSISSHDPKVTVGLTATPIRGDKKATIFGDRSPDVVITMKEAVKEKAIRDLQYIKSSYSVDIAKGTEIVTMSLHDIAREAAEKGVDISEWEVKNNVRYLTKYIQPIVGEAIHDLVVANANLGKASGKVCHQLIVYCMSFKHAMAVADVINQHLATDALIHGLKGGQKFAEVISDGVDAEGEVQRLSPTHNEEVLARFNDPDPVSCLKCIVCVNKLSEGYDNSRVTHIALLNMVQGDKPSIWQMLGRALRWCHLMSILQNVAKIYAGRDHPIWGVVQDGDGEGKVISRGGPGDGEPQWNMIKDADRWRVSDVLHLGFERDELFAEMNVGTESDCVDAVVNRESGVSQLIQSGVDPNNRQAIGDFIYGILTEQHNKKLFQISEQDERKIWRTWNKEAVGIFAGNIHRQNFRGPEEKSQFRDTCASVNSKLTFQEKP